MYTANKPLWPISQTICLVIPRSRLLVYTPRKVTSSSLLPVLPILRFNWNKAFESFALPWLLIRAHFHLAIALAKYGVQLSRSFDCRVGEAIASFAANNSQYVSLMSTTCSLFIRQFVNTDVHRVFRLCVANYRGLGTVDGRSKNHARICFRDCEGMLPRTCRCKEIAFDRWLSIFPVKGIAKILILVGCTLVVIVCEEEERWLGGFFGSFELLPNGIPHK